MIEYATALRSELRQLQDCGLYFDEFPPALGWAPSASPCWLRAPMLERIAEAGRIWNIRMGYRRMQRGLLQAFTHMSPEWDLFEEVPA